MKNATLSETVAEGPLPLYYRIQLDIREKLKKGEWRVGDQIPTEHDLCAMYGVSQITIRRALGNLAAEGILVRKAGSGTFVMEPVVTTGVHGLTSFSDEMTALGLRPATKVLDTRIAPAPPEAAGHLQLEPGDPVVVITRLRLGNGRPIAIQTASLPASRFDGLERINLADRSLYEVLDDIYGVVPTSAEETFTVATMMQPNAQLLQVEEGAPGFYLERITFVAAIPFEFVSAFIRGDGYRIRLSLRPTPGTIVRHSRSGVLG